MKCRYCIYLKRRKGGNSMKDKTTALILSILLGGIGVDRFYLGYTGMGILKLLTGGCFGILWLIDIINIATGKLQPADGSGYKESYQRSRNTRDQCFSPAHKKAPVPSEPEPFYAASTSSASVSGSNVM